MVSIRLVAGALALAGVMAAADARAAAGVAQDSRAAIAAAPINLNAAMADDLQKLPGIGLAMATRILDYRQKSGGFKKVEDLMNVTGIGEKNFLKLKPLVTVVAVRSAER